VKIGAIVEGATDTAFLSGLRDRWCPDAILENIEYRGSRARYRDYPKLCDVAEARGCDVLILLTDSNNAPYSVTRKQELSHMPSPSPVHVLVGVAARNIECWICAEPGYVGKESNQPFAKFNVQDPKNAFNEAFNISTFNQQKPLIAALVSKAPLRSWIKNSSSFRTFYNDVRQVSATLGCHIPNELDR
jgi:hypothetical protein